MKKFIVTFEHHKYFNGGMAVYTRTEEIKARTEKSATNKFFKQIGRASCRERV